ncbi:Tab2/Atab2 family RNA-binding protein [Kovacikia minuta CCNUW1]|uniref:Tab2/Atab2 family RNA-binding protein n=1 Tax=Kovacikia minuta TaxID=2931930 RepID=UPI001CC9391A|nr:Tab2/Atab2 family RNA-binding protein [Kovacikia minuta]UBF25280.1 Tab2/Atab2 family RNA-binding protein [Kovacikia minuta CCNUW1]
MPTIWELDFYSRPLIDEQGKKVWEILVCESPLSVDRQPDSLFRYAEFCPSNEVNSVRLKTAIEKAISQSGQSPSKIRFFRLAMKNMITKACEELGISASLSRHTIALNQWMQQRLKEVYPQEPGFQPGTTPTVSFAETNPQALPDALLGQKWAFVTLTAEALKDMNEWAIDFGEAFPLSLVGVKPETLIPGLVIFSSRAVPMAAWMSGLELACLKVEEGSPTRLLLETGVGDRWTIANLADTKLLAEAKNFEANKQQAQGVHFLAIQANPETEAFAGFWLLQEDKLA